MPIPGNEFYWKEEEIIPPLRQFVSNGLTISRVKRVKKHCLAFNFACKPHDTFLVNRVLVHNCSHVIEHLPTVEDAALAVNELMRVADQVWVAYPNKQSVIAYLIPDHYLWVTEKDGYLFFEQRLLIKGLTVIPIENR